MHSRLEFLKFLALAPLGGSVSVLGKRVTIHVNAKGDGSDETAVINAAIVRANRQSGGTVILPAHKTIRSDGIRLKDGVTLFVPKTTTLKLTDRPRGSLIRNDDVQRGNRNIGVAGGGTLDGNEARVPQDATTEGFSCITFQHVKGFVVRDMQIKDARQSCINLQFACQDGTVTNCRMSNAGNDCLLVRADCSNISIQKCHAKNGGHVRTALAGRPNRTGYEVADGCRRVTIDSCIAENAADDGFGVNNHGAVSRQGATGGPFATVVKNCVSINANKYGFHLFAQGPDGPDGIVVQDCFAEGGLDGYRIEETVAGATIGGVTLRRCRAGVARAGTTIQVVPPSRMGFSTSISSGVLILTHCEALNARGHGYNLASPRVGGTARLIGCRAAGSRLNGFTVTTESNITFEACVSRSNRQQGFLSAGGTTHRYVNCTGTSNGFNGLQVSGGATGVAVTRGAYDNNGHYGILNTAGPGHVAVVSAEALGNKLGQIRI